VTIGLQSQPSLKTLRFIAAKSGSDTLNLPFFDDFSGNRVVPDPTKWEDDYVLINDTYSNSQITTGIATFDALDDKGNLYETSSSIRFEADHLTSLPVNLFYPASDSIFLSFFYQPGGLADIPEYNDSLTLQFYSPGDGKWNSVWMAHGGKYEDFRAVILKIDNPKYLVKGFRFRFINYATLSPDVTDPSLVGNCDQWNLDYVVLNKNRNSADTVFHDVAFRLPLRSLLNTYEAMPYKQFRQIYLQEMGTSIPVHYRNNDNITRNVTRNFQIWDMFGNTLAKSFSAGAVNIAPRTNEDFNADLFYTFTSPIEDSALFRVKAWLVTDVFDPRDNDTLTYYQVFKNYFSFDDGSAEEGYGISGLGSRNARVAVRFKSYLKDTLRAVSICFNDSYLNSNLRNFDIVVWADNNGVPGDVLYTRENVTVTRGSSINGFYRYSFTDPVPVEGTFYVGWKQRSETFLNAGFDINTLPGGRQFYWINGNWIASAAKGTIMIRPIAGSPLTTSINDIYYKKNNSIRFWPNPASDRITIDPGSLPSDGSADLSIADLQGRVLIKEQCKGEVNISALHNGIYILILSNNGIPYRYGRLIKSN
jgi:hypothetical protein